MRISEQEFEKGGNKKKRTLFSIGFEEIEILHAVLVKAMATFPELTDKAAYGRMKNMAKAMSVYLGRSKPHLSRTDAGHKCPYCERKLYGDNGVEMHIRYIHKDKIQKKDEKTI